MLENMKVYKIMNYNEMQEEMLKVEADQGQELAEAEVVVVVIQVNYYQFILFIFIIY